MIIVSDTTALTTLMKVGLESVLERLFGRVVIPERVVRELRQYHSEIPDWCEVRKVDAHPLLPLVALTIDAGEAEAICLALELKADAILLDDRKGKREAESRGLACLALPAILLEAKRQGLIPSLKAALGLLAERGNYRLKARAMEALLRAAGEQSD